MAFHNRLKQAREKAKLTQAQVATFLGIAKSTYSGYETGNSEPSMANIVNMIHLFEVSPEFLWQDEMGAQKVPAKQDAPDLRNVQVRSSDEEELLSLYRQLSTSGKNVALTTLKAFANSPDMKKETQDMSAM